MSQINIERMLQGSSTPVDPDLIDNVRQRLFGNSGIRSPKLPDNYEIHRELGRGRFGRVYEATDRQFPRRVAIKIIEYGNASSLARIEREAHALATLTHPNIVTIFEKGIAGAGHYFLAMELVPGTRLDDWMRDPGRQLDEVLEVFAQAADGLHHAHQRGLVHRDFKPSNAVVDPSGRLRILDFGLVKRQDDAATAEGLRPPSSRPSAGGSTLSEPTSCSPRTPKSSSKDDPPSPRSRTLGTPAYASLEQLEGRGADSRSDQFSLCIALFEACYGFRPFSGRNLIELSLQISSRTVARGTPRWKVPRWLKKLLRRGLSPNPDDRYEDVGKIAALLRVHLRPRVGPWMGLAAGVGLTLAILSIQETTPPKAPLVFDAWPTPRSRLNTEKHYGSRLRQKLDLYEDAWHRSYSEYYESPPGAASDAWRACLIDARGHFREFVAELESLPLRSASLPEIAFTAPERLWLIELFAPSHCSLPVSTPSIDEHIVTVLFEAQAQRLAGNYAEAGAGLESIRANASFNSLGLARGLFHYELGTVLLHQRNPRAREAFAISALSNGGDEGLVVHALARGIEAAVLIKEPGGAFSSAELARMSETLRQNGAPDAIARYSEGLVHFGKQEYRLASVAYREARSAFMKQEASPYRDYMIAHCILHYAYAESNLQSPNIDTEEIQVGLATIAEVIGVHSPVYLQHGLNVAHVLREEALENDEPLLLTAADEILGRLTSNFDTDSVSIPSFEILRLRAEKLLVETLKTVSPPPEVQRDWTQRATSLSAMMDARHNDPASEDPRYSTQIRETSFIVHVNAYLANPAERQFSYTRASGAVDAYAASAASANMLPYVCRYYDEDVQNNEREEKGDLTEISEIAERLQALCG